MVQLKTCTLPEYSLMVGNDTFVVKNVELAIVPKGAEGISLSELKRVHAIVAHRMLSREKKICPSAWTEFFFDVLCESSMNIMAKQTGLPQEALFDLEANTWCPLSGDNWKRARIALSVRLNGILL